MGGKLSKKKKGYNVNDPKEQSEGPAGDQTEKQKDESPVSTAQEKTEPEAPNISNTEEETAPSQRCEEKSVRGMEEGVPSKEAAVEAPLLGERQVQVGGDNDAQSAHGKPKVGEQATATELSSGASGPEKEALCTAKPEVLPLYQETSEQSPESQTMKKSSEAAEATDMSTEAAFEKIRNKDSKAENEPVPHGLPHKEVLHMSAAHEEELEAVIQTQSDATEIMASEESKSETSHVPKPVSDHSGEPSTLTGAAEVGLIDDSSPIPDDSIGAAAVTANSSEHEESHAPDSQSTPQVLPDVLPEDGNTRSTETKMKDSENTLRPSAIAHVENVVQCPISQAEDKMFCNVEGPSEIPKDTQTKTSRAELSSVKGAPADDKVEDPGMVKNVDDGPTTMNSEAGEKHLNNTSPSAEVSSAAKISTISNEIFSLGEEAKHENGVSESTSSTTEVSGNPTLEQQSLYVDKTHTLAVDKQSRLQQECVNGITEPETPDKPNKVKDHELQKETDLMESMNGPVTEMTSVISASEGPELI